MAEDLAATGTPDAEVPEAESVPDAVAVDDTGSSGGDGNEQDVGSPSSGDDSGSSSGSDSDSGIIIIYLDSGSVAPPGQTMDASMASGGTPDSSNESPGPTSTDGGRETGAPHGGGVVLHGPLVGPTSQQGGPPLGGDDADAPASGGDDSSSGGVSFGDAAPWGGGAGDDGGSSNLDLPPTRAIIGCAGCSVPDAADSGALAWLVVALTVGLRIWRRR